MPVSEEVRRAEAEIDEHIQNLKVWRSDRNLILRALLDYYRDAIEVVFSIQGWARETDQPEAAQGAFALEHQLHSGILQAIKWASTLARKGARQRAPNAEALRKVFDKGTTYEVLVDALKMAQHDLVRIACDSLERSLTIYEGGNQTGFDNQLVQHQHNMNPLVLYSRLTQDEDQLTTRWTAGDYRRTIRKLAEQAHGASEETFVSTFHGAEPPLFSRPVVLEVYAPTDSAEDAVLEDMSFPSPSTPPRALYSWTSWLDSPLVVVDGRRLATSNVLIALLNLGEMHMLRLAARVDPEQYSRVSQRREDVMVADCENVLTNAGWTTEPRKKLKNPDAEIDLLATRGSDKMVLELKSLMRPEAPWEVFKRNADVLKGIKQVASNVPRVSGTVGVVLTDGYRGDYVTWKESLQVSVPTGTLDDLTDIAANPTTAMALLKERSGFDSSQPGSDLGERTLSLAGWTLRLVDAPPPDGAEQST